MAKKNLFNRELSWLSFNNRVLQECLDPSVPLYEKIKFMAIFSSNLDEFFRVRVASLRNLLSLKKTGSLKFNPSKLLKDIHDKVTKDQELLGMVLKDTVLAGLKKRHIHLIKKDEVPTELLPYTEKYFADQLLPYLHPVIISSQTQHPFLKNKALYHAVNFKKNKQKKDDDFALLEIPVHHTGRFIHLPSINKKKYVIFVDDLIRLYIGKVFQGRKIESVYSLKLTRDAEMYIDDEFSGSLLQKIKDGISRRKTGTACRFLYDEKIDKNLLHRLQTTLELSKDDLVPGGRYHNFNDFHSFPKLSSSKDFDKPLAPLPLKEFEDSSDYFEVLKQKDVLINFPYQSYDYVINFLDQAANDEAVRDIKITLYRIANPSLILEKLIQAALNGKSVTAFIELKARFDEESNIKGAEQLERSGVKIIYSIPGIKVHSKICLITRAEKTGLQYYAYLATGNFNEKTSEIYADMGLFTAKQAYSEDLNKVFAHLNGRENSPEFKKLLVAPYNMRNTFEKLIKQEIKHAQEGKKAEIIIKLNSLQDSGMIKNLYKASKKGVKIKIIVRGICCLIPDQPNSGNIEIRSIIDRFLEHSRIYIFHNNGQPFYFSGSADWMSRNLKRRIEVIFPIIDRRAIQIIKKKIDIQWKDNLKSRIIDKSQTNKYVKRNPRSKIVRAQHDFYTYLKSLNS